MTVFLVFLFAYALSQFFRACLAVIAPELQADLGLSAADLGLVSGAWFVAFALAQFGVGWSLDRVGPRRTVTVTMLAAVLGSIVFAQAGGAGGAILGMALIGIGCSAVYMGALFIFARTLAPERFAMLASWLIALGSAGNLLGTTPLSIAAATLGWRGTFLAIAGVTALSALLVALLVRDPPPAERAHTGGGPIADFVAVLRLRALWPILPITFVSYSVVAAERGLWIGPYLADVFGLDGVARGNAALAMAAAMSLGAFAYGPLDRVFGTKKWVALVGTGLAGAIFVALGLLPIVSATVATVLLSAAGFFGLTYGVIMAHARSFFPDHLIGRGLTLVNFLFIGGAALIQPLSGALMEGLEGQGVGAEAAYQRLHLLFGAAILVAVIVYLFSWETSPARGQADAKP